MKPGDQSGFTLPEAMIAGLLTLFLALPAMTLLRDTYRFADQMQSRSRLDGEARQTFDLLGDGSAILSNAGAQTSARGFQLVEGLRSRQTAPSGSSLRSLSQFLLPDGSLAVSGDAIPAMTIVCAGVSNPIPDCTGTETRTVQGWLGSDPLVSVSGQEAAVGLTVTDPFRALRATNNPASATEQYRSIYTLGVQANP